MIAAPIAWHNTCVLQHETTYVASSDKRIASISGSALHDCQMFERSLCFVPRYPGDSLASSFCHKKLFEGVTIQDLTNYCVYSCTPGSRPLVSMVDDQRALFGCGEGGAVGGMLLLRGTKNQEAWARDRLRFL
ncbi:hypothetical protein J6590_072307 [Homalodisca vitripennis]|nr:hypothetical protein J6590_072307 [Homalodisca vitripennis]